MKTITLTLSDKLADSILNLATIFEMEPGDLLEHTAGFVFDQLNTGDGLPDELEVMFYATRSEAVAVGKKTVAFSRAIRHPLEGFGVIAGEDGFCIRFFIHDYHSTVWDWCERTGADFDSSRERSDHEMRIARADNQGRWVPFDLRWLTISGPRTLVSVEF